MANEELKAKLLERIQTRLSERVLGTPKNESKAGFFKRAVEGARTALTGPKVLRDKVTATAKHFLDPAKERLVATKESIKQGSFAPLKESFRKQYDDVLPQEGDTAKDVARKNIALVTGSINIGGTGKPKPIPKAAINTSRLSITPKARLAVDDLAARIRPELERVRGKVLKNEEVLEAAKTSRVLTKASSRESTLKSEAALLRTRQNLAALAEGKGVSKDFVEQLRIVKAEATRRGRELQALAIDATPELNTVKTKLVKELLNLGIEADDIIKAATNVDFSNAKQVTKFYRQFVKPKFSELIDEYRYINLLSSPRTHIVNAFSNMLQGAVLNPATKLTSGLIDIVASKLTGKTRQAYVAEVPAYFRGVVNSVGDATRGFIRALKGESLIERPDLFEIPTGSKALSAFQFVPRLLDAGDVFFRNLIQGGEREALALRYTKQGKELAWPLIDEAAAEKARYWVFRKALDPSNATGQGIVLSKIDAVTTAAYSLRKVPGMKWFIPFIQTPMNILKQGIEFSPLGVATLPGSTQKVEQISKALVGSAVFTGTAYLAAQGDVTWAAPRNKKEREAFYAAGRQPYSVKVGDKWVSFSKLGPLAYPMAMAAGFQWHLNENPENVTDSNLAKTGDVLFGLAEFFSDQSYMQGISDFLDVAQGDQTAVTRIATNAPGQLIPLSSLQRWVAQMVDPVYRKKDNTLSTEAIIDNLKAGLPFLSKDLPAYTNPFGFPSQRQFPLFNATSPVNVTEEQLLFEGQLQGIRAQRRATKFQDQQDEVEERIKDQLRQRLFAQ